MKIMTGFFQTCHYAYWTTNFGREDGTVNNSRQQPRDEIRKGWSNQKVDNGHSNQVNNGHSNQVASGHSKQVDSGHSKQVDSAHIKQVDSGHINQVDSGHIKQVDWSYQPC